jgi:two-component system C4-dicarboxylate transport sensor histidine kinase DctB
VQADRIQLQQVMLNLIMNAGEAMAAGAGAERRLTIRTGAVDYGVQISFVDGGPGFPAEAYDKLFEPFYTTKKPGEGLGLGLAISAGFVAELGGRRVARNAPDGGAVFELVLPRDRGHSQAAE